MNCRERELAAIRHELPDQIPMDAIAVENTSALATYLGIAEQEVIPHLGLCGRLVGIAHVDAESGRDAGRNEWGALAGGVEYGSTHTYIPWQARQRSSRWSGMPGQIRLSMTMRVRQHRQRSMPTGTRFAVRIGSRCFVECALWLGCRRL